MKNQPNYFFIGLVLAGLLNHAAGNFEMAAALLSAAITWVIFDK